jgi:DnaJ-class molecular chaperone
MADNTGCAHIDALSSIKHAERRECEECVKKGAKWVHLRTCQSCGGDTVLR